MSRAITHLPFVAGSRLTIFLSACRLSEESSMREQCFRSPTRTKRRQNGTGERPNYCTKPNQLKRVWRERYDKQRRKRFIDADRSWDTDGGVDAAVLAAGGVIRRTPAGRCADTCKGDGRRAGSVSQREGEARSARHSLSASGRRFKLRAGRRWRVTLHISRLVIRCARKVSGSALGAWGRRTSG